MLGSQGGSPSVCNGYTNSGFTNVTGSAGSAALNITGMPNPTGLTVGELVSGSGSSLQVQPGSEIASITTNHLGTIVGISLTLPLTGMGTNQSLTITIAGNNTGTLILDNYGGTGLNQCWQKINYRGDPREFGAYGDGTSGTPHDDTVAIQNWFGAYGNVNANANFVPATAPPNFGPWNASIPANYMVIAPLTCPDNALIQGLATQSTGASPLVRIFAERNPSGTSFASNAPAAVLTLGNRCRLSGVAVDGSGLQMNGTTNGTPATPSQYVTNLDPHQIGQIQLGDIATAADIPSSPSLTSVVGVSSSSGSLGTACYPTVPYPCVTLSTTVTTSHSELVSFNGPNAVSVIGSRDTIDGHSLIENGYNNVACTSTAMAGLQLKDSQFTSSGADDLALGGCPNVRVTGNVISGAGGRGVRFGGTDITVANNVIEQSAGTGLDLTGAEKLSVNGNFLDDN
ncbi:MAG TPA: right-handed parallel beta-helix repeat-containing protein, partial [Rhizomicrobium sp.]|nr:right-handed parallel beta-helix repeat-containing protein [Rhizomicrobium sp.]